MSMQIRQNSWFMILIFIADDSLKKIKGGIKKIKVKVGVTVKSEVKRETRKRQGGRTAEKTHIKSDFSHENAARKPPEERF